MTGVRAQRRRIDIASLKSLAELLRRAAEDPFSVADDAVLVGALRSQGALASYENAGLGITKMSLNHQRLIAGHVFGGFEPLDELRRRAHDACERRLANSERGLTKSRLKARVESLEDAVRVLQQDLFLLQRAYDIRCTQARRYAAAAGSDTLALSVKEQAEIDASFALRRTPVRDSNVTSIAAARRHDRLTK